MLTISLTVIFCSVIFMILGAMYEIRDDNKFWAILYICATAFGLATAATVVADHIIKGLT